MNQPIDAPAKQLDMNSTNRKFVFSTNVIALLMYFFFLFCFFYDAILFAILFITYKNKIAPILPIVVFFVNDFHVVVVSNVFCVTKTYLIRLFVFSTLLFFLCVCYCYCSHMKQPCIVFVIHMTLFFNILKRTNERMNE